MSSRIRGYIRPRGGKLEAVIIVPGRNRPITKATGLAIGREGEARAALASALAEAAAGDTTVGSGITVSGWGEKWTGAREKKASSKNEASLLRHHLYPMLGHVPLESVTKAMMLDWVRSLPGRVSERTREQISARTVHHLADVTKRCFGEAVDRDLIAENPCAWRAKRDLPPKRDVDASKREDDAFALAEVARLISDPSLPLWHRVAYAGLFLAGPRPGELLVRRWNDLDESWAPLPLLRAFTGWNSKLGEEGPTKTGARTHLPVHPAWRALLGEWRAEGWARHVGRAPRPEDYLLASEDGRVEPGWNLNRWFKEDAERLGLRSGRSVYACRATFISLSQEGGAAERDVKRITHPSPVEAFDSYQRKRALWPRYCSAVMAIRLPPVAIPSSGGIATLSHAAGARSKNACRSEELQAFQGVGAAGFEPATPAV